MIHERPVEFRENNVFDQVVAISTCCCQDQGKTQMTVRFDKNVFFSNEICNADVTIDNRLCKLRITSVDFEVEQKISINGAHHWSGKFDIIKTTDIEGVNA